jgi:hypothetical protein
VRLAAIAVALVAVGGLAVAWVLGAFDDEPPPPPVAAITLDARVPAEALGRRADALEAAAAVGSGELDPLLAQDPLALDLPEVAQGGVTLRDVSVRREGADASAEATVDPAQLAALAPGEVDLAYDAEASADAGGAIVLSGTASALGIDVPVTVSVGVQDGRVVAQPEGLPVGETVLFDDPRVLVTSLTGEPQADGSLRVRAEAQVVG